MYMAPAGYYMLGLDVVLSVALWVIVSNVWIITLVLIVNLYL